MEEVLEKVQTRQYSSYKDTGLKWLGKIPSHWEVQRGKWLFIKQERLVRKGDEIITCFRDGQVTLRSNRKTEGFTNALKEHGYQGIRVGDLVIHNMDAFAGAIGVSDSDGKSTPVYSACTPRSSDKIDSYYYAYFLRNLAKNGFIESLAKGIRERSTDFRFSDFGELMLPLPPVGEQTGIVKFLGLKLGQIDKAIQIKEKQIELLKERRQILIHKAVTQGLNPNVKMKDSGVEWIGEIPIHWNVRHLKYILSERNERSGTGEEPLFMVSQTLGLVIRAENHDKAEVAQTSVGSKIVYKNDLVFNKLKAHLGVFFKSTIDFKGLVSPDYAVYSSKGLIKDLKYLELLFRHPAYISQFICKATGIVEGLIRLYTGDLFGIKVPVPPIEEQLQILQHVENLNTKIDKAISVQSMQMQFLKEYKSSLINNAVTGKIKVV